jgi:hypothetical protein
MHLKPEYINIMPSTGLIFRDNGTTPSETKPAFHEPASVTTCIIQNIAFGSFIYLEERPGEQAGGGIPESSNCPKRQFDFVILRPPSLKDLDVET